jgi:hypothetical protein
MIPDKPDQDHCGCDCVYWLRPARRIGASPFFAFTGSKAPGENRVARRRRVLKAGRIEFNGNGIECTVRNISETGAAIEVVSPFQCHLAFVLVIPSMEASSRAM